MAVIVVMGVIDILGCALWPKVVGGQKALDGWIDGGGRTQLSCHHRRRTNAFTKEVHPQGHRVRAWSVHKAKDRVTYHLQINQKKA